MELVEKHPLVLLNIIDDFFWTWKILPLICCFSIWIVILADKEELITLAESRLVIMITYSLANKWMFSINQKQLMKIY